MWDKFKQLDSLSVQEISNYANLLANLVAHFSISLGFLKVLTFESLEPQVVLYLRIFFVTLLSQYNNDTIKQVFLRINKQQELKPVREGILFFFKQIPLEVKTKNEEKEKILQQNLKTARYIMKQSIMSTL